MSASESSETETTTIMESPPPTSTNSRQWSFMKMMSLAHGKYPQRRGLYLHGLIAFATWLWPILLRTTALLDLLATIVNRRLHQECASNNNNHAAEQDCQYILRLFSTDMRLSSSGVATKAFVWLDDNSLYLGFAFSLLWCIQAFVIATRSTEQALEKNQRRFVLNYLAQRIAQRRERKQHQNNEEDTEEDPDNTEEDDDIELDKFKIKFTYYTSLIRQFLCLPVGFYLLLWQLGKNSIVNDPSPVHIPTAHAPPVELKELLESTYQFVEQLPPEYQAFSNETKLALGFALAKHTTLSFHRTTGARCHLLWKKRRWKYGLQLGFRALRHPRLAVHNTKAVLSAIRWIQYLRPLIAGALKLFNNIRSMIKMYRQRRRRKLAQKVRKLLRTQLSPEQRQHQAAQTIQSTWRSHQQRQTSHDLLLSQWEREQRAARTMQSALRSGLKRRRAKRERQASELRHLKERRSSVSSDWTIVAMPTQPQPRQDTLAVTTKQWSSSQQARLDELQEALATNKHPTKSSSKTIDERLLMKPNTRFQIIWKALFVFVATMEVTARILNPVLAQQTSKITGEPLTLSSKIKHAFLVMPVDKLPQCSCIKLAQQQQRASSKPSKLAWLKRRQKYTQPKPPLPSSQMFQVWTHSCRHSPWYCHPIYYLAQARYNRLVHWIVDEAYMIMSAIAFLDAPVTFFTGMYCPDTGMLLPKPFFQRWIAPGLLMTLLINPRIRPVTRILVEFGKRCFQVGPIRAWRWIRVFYPVLLALLDLVEYQIWIPLVHYANLHSRKYVPPSPHHGLPPLSPHRTSLTMSSLKRSSIVPS